MHNLGVPTTRALSLVVSTTETARRAWYSGNNDDIHAHIHGDMDIEQLEPCAITCRAAPSFLRVGQVELHARRAKRTGDLEPLRKIVRHALRREFPDIPSEEVTGAAVLSMLRAVRDRLVDLVVHWTRVGFCQGNFNSDNCLLAGRTLDYGPFGFMEAYDPRWCMWVGGGRHFAFNNQAGSCGWLHSVQS